MASIVDHFSPLALAHLEMTEMLRTYFVTSACFVDLFSPHSCSYGTNLVNTFGAPLKQGICLI